MNETCRNLRCVLVVCLALTGCDSSQLNKTIAQTADAIHHNPTTTVLLIDTSGSIRPEDVDIYTRSVHAAERALRPGDHFVLAAIGNADRSS